MRDAIRRDPTRSGYLVRIRPALFAVWAYPTHSPLLLLGLKISCGHQSLILLFYFTLTKQDSMKVGIFGWFGAREAHLRKFETLYTRLGARKVNVYPTSIVKSMTYHGWKQMRKECQGSSELRSLDVVHLFSGGVFPYYNWRRTVPGFAPRFVVYDSGPYLACGHQVERYLRNGGIVPRNFPFPWASLCDRLWALEGADIPAERSAILATLTCEAPKLFLNSTVDDMINPGAMEELRVRNELVGGGRIHEHWWDDSGHTQHYRTHPAEYEALLHAYVG